MKNNVNVKSNKQSRAEELFERTKISKAIWIVAIPSLLTSFMIGLYNFVDQIFIQNFVPKNRFMFDNGANIGEIYDYLTITVTDRANDYFNLYNMYISNLPQGVIQPALITTNTVVSTTSVTFQPFTIFSNSIVFLIPVGASVYYTKCISKKFEQSGRDLWATMFWLTIICALIATTLSVIFVFAGVTELIAGRTVLTGYKTLSPAQLAQLQDYYDAAFKISVKWANQFILIYAGGTVLQALSTLLSYLIRSEGYNTYVMFWGIAANLANVALDAVFIIPLKMGVLGGVIATIIGFAINLLAYVYYVIRKDIQGKTWLSFRNIFKFRFSKKLLLPTVSLGFSGFIRSFGMSFTLLIMGIIISKAPFGDPSHFQFYWSKATPILTLFLLSIFGINDGARALLTYNYTHRDFARCKSVYLWSMIIAVSYSIIAYVFVASTTTVIWMPLLNVDASLAKGTQIAIIVLMLRLIGIAIMISGLVSFQGTNNIGKSILSTTLESFITFPIVISTAFGIAYGISGGIMNTAANWLIFGAFVFNSLVASSIVFGYSYWYITKKVPKIDQSKVSWSRKIEHAFFDEAAKLEEAYQAKMQNITN